VLSVPWMALRNCEMADYLAGCLAHESQVTGICLLDQKDLRSRID